MEWNELKSGYVIRFTPVYRESITSNEWHDVKIIILLGEKCSDGSSFTGNVLTGLDYPKDVYRSFMIPNMDNMSTVTIPYSKFSKFKHCITLADKSDYKSIADRINSHIQSYFDLYNTEKVWGEFILKKVNEFLSHKKVNGKNE